MHGTSRRNNRSPPHQLTGTNFEHTTDGRNLATNTSLGASGFLASLTGKPAPAGIYNGVTAYSPDGKILASGDSNTNQESPTLFNVYLYDAASGAAVAHLATGDTTQSGDIQAAFAFSPDGKTVAVAGQNLSPKAGVAEVELWSWAGQQQPVTLSWNIPRSSIDDNDPQAVPWDQANGSDEVNTLAFSPDGKLLATSTEYIYVAGPVYTGIQLWDPATGKLITTVTLKGGGSVCFSPDGKTLAFGGVDGNTVELWDVASQKTLATINLGQQADGTPSYEGSQTFSPDGKTIAVPVPGGVQLWSVG